MELCHCGVEEEQGGVKTRRRETDSFIVQVREDSGLKRKVGRHIPLILGKQNKQALVCGWS